MSATEYDWLSLESDEDVIWSGQPELLGYAWVFITGIALIPLFGAGLVIIASTYFYAKNTAYVITTDSVFKKTGIFSRKITDIGHENIQDTGYNQGVVGRQYGFGTVRISTAGGSGVEMSLSHVPDPLAVQSHLDGVAIKNRSGDESIDGGGSELVRIDAAALEELVEEMRETRKALESIEERLDEQ